MNIKMHEYEIQMQLILIQYVWTKQNWINWFNWCCVLFHQYFWQFSHSGISYNKNTNTHIQISNEEHKSVGLVNQLEGLVGRDYKSFAGASEDRLLLAFGSIWTPFNLQFMVREGSVAVAVLLDFVQIRGEGGGPCPIFLSPFHKCIFGQ